MIAIIKYNAGNFTSVKNTIEKLTKKKQREVGKAGNKGKGKKDREKGKGW